jgi:hypothetical protein
MNQTQSDKPKGKPRGRKGGRKPLTVPHIRKNIYLSIIEWAALAAIHPSPSHAIRFIIKERIK